MPKVFTCKQWAFLDATNIPDAVVVALFPPEAVGCPAMGRAFVNTAAYNQERYYGMCSDILLRFLSAGRGGLGPPGAGERMRLLAGEA